jgi:hypothetical protein
VRESAGLDVMRATGGTMPARGAGPAVLAHGAPAAAATPAVFGDFPVPAPRGASSARSGLNSIGGIGGGGGGGGGGVPSTPASATASPARPGANSASHGAASATASAAAHI